MNYPRRTVKQDWDDTSFAYDRENMIVVAVFWDVRKYRIAHAWITDDLGEIARLADYPFVHSSGDQSFVYKTIQSNCDHPDMDYYPTHAYCTVCALKFKGDFREQMRKQLKQTLPNISKKGLDFFLKK